VAYHRGLLLFQLRQCLLAASRRRGVSLILVVAWSGIAQLLIWVQTDRVEHRGIRYTIRARIEREQWSVAIHPTDVEMKGKVVIGSREKAELQALAMINDWLKKQQWR
jgi:hypothetical protein